ncbi:hypothetical protein JCM11491_006479 [Sporobolomyces phaffii]
MQPNGSYTYPTNQPLPAPHPAFFGVRYPLPHDFAAPVGPLVPHPPYAYPPYPQSFGYASQAYSSSYPYSYPSQQAPPLAPTPASSASSNLASSRKPPLQTSSQTASVAPSRKADSPPCAEQVRDRQILDQHRVMSAPDEYGLVMRQLSAMTVDKLKLSLKKLNESFSLGLKFSGLKAELYNRLRGEVDRIYTFDRPRWPLAKDIIDQIYRGYTTPTSYAPAGSGYGTSATTGGAVSAGGYRASTSAYGAATSGYTAASSTGYGGGGRPLGGTAAPTGASRFGGAGTGSAYGASTSAHLGGGGAAGAAVQRWQNDDVPIKFRPSPFYRVEKSLSPPMTLVKADQGDRKVAAMSFGLTEAQRMLINKARESPDNPQFEVRLYCTSDNNYAIGRPHASQFPAPIEFPQASEIKLNNVTVNANTKGIKKQPGTTPPVNLSSKKGPTVLTGPGQLNKVEIIYTNTDRTTYYMVTYLVETTPVRKVVEKVKAGRTKPKEEVIQSIKDINLDEEIAAGPLGLSLRDPLSFARIGTPVRSRMCNHISCFDAETWFEMNEQTPTWNCPICSKTLKFEDMVVDGYFEEILKICPSSVDSVTVNPDGTWRSDDNKHGTGPPRAEKASAHNASTRNSPRPEREESTKPDISGKGKSKAQPEALTLDSDSEDEPLAKRPRTGAFGLNGGGAGGSSSGSPFVAGTNSNGLRNGRGASEVLDLTLSDSDDDQPPPARPAPRPPIANTMARTSSGAGGVKTVADVQRDIDAMQQRMREEYGEDWRTRFNV